MPKLRHFCSLMRFGTFHILQFLNREMLHGARGGKYM